MRTDSATVTHTELITADDRMFVRRLASKSANEIANVGPLELTCAKATADAA